MSSFVDLIPGNFLNGNLTELHVRTPCSETETSLIWFKAVTVTCGLFAARFSLFTSMSNAKIVWSGIGYKNVSLLLSQAMTSGFPFAFILMIGLGLLGYEKNYSISALSSLTNYPSYFTQMGVLMFANTLFYGISMAKMGPVALTIMSQLLFPISTFVNMFLFDQVVGGKQIFCLTLIVMTVIGCIWIFFSNGIKPPDYDFIDAVYTVEPQGVVCIFIFFLTALFQPIVIRSARPDPLPLDFPSSDMVLFGAGSVFAFPLVFLCWWFGAMTGFMQEESWNLAKYIVVYVKEALTTLHCAYDCTEYSIYWLPYLRIVLSFIFNHWIMLKCFTYLDNNVVDFEIIKQITETLSILFMNWDPSGFKPIAQTAWTLIFGLSFNSFLAYEYYHAENESGR